MARPLLPRSKTVPVTIWGAILTADLQNSIRSNDGLSTSGGQIQQQVLHIKLVFTPQTDPGLTVNANLDVAITGTETTTT